MMRFVLRTAAVFATLGLVAGLLALAAEAAAFA